MNIRPEGRFTVEIMDKVATPKGVTISGDIGHILYLNPDLTLNDLLDNLKRMQWRPNEELVRGVLEDYIIYKHVQRNEESNTYNMTEFGLISFISGWW